MANEYTTTKDSIIAEFSDEEHGDDYARAFLVAGFLQDVAELLFRARKHAKLTQQQLAERTGRKDKASISRWERDFSGNMSLDVFSQLALACGFVPRLTLVPFGWAKEEELFHLEHPDAVHLDIRIQKEHDTDSVLVSEEHFFNWVDDPTRDEALAHLWSSLAEELCLLTERKETLSWHLRQELEYLRKLKTAGLL